MQVNRLAGVGIGAAFILSSLVYLQAGQQPATAPQEPVVPPVQSPRMPLSPVAIAGAGVTPAYEGWFQNPDGSFTMLLGYSNRNQNQVVDIPVGPSNRIEPSGPDYGQPTHFLTGGARNGRQYGVFSIVVPKDFGNKKLTWTITANGQAQSISPYINPPYIVAPFFRSDNGNSPPVVKMTATGPELTGPPKGMALTLTASVNQPVTLDMWASDKGNTVDQQNQFGPPPVARGRGAQAPGGAAAPDPAAPAAAPGAAPTGDAAGAGAAQGRGGAGAGAGPGGRGGAAAGRGGGGGGRGGATAPITVFWSKFRGPGAVTFANARPAVVPDAETGKMFTKQGDFAGKVTTTATFAAPGEYIVRGQVNDASGDGGGGDQCCWTNVLVKVTVK